MKGKIEQLCRVSAQSSRVVIGVMSGTSLDGLDIAVCRLSGSGPGTGLEIIAFETVSYDEAFKNEIRSVFSRRQVDLEKVCLLNAWVAVQHGNMVLDCLKRWKIDISEVDLLASHGQTIYHAPKILHQQAKFGNATLQIGDGDHLAVTTGIITISDFRQKHIAAGGEGAPLAAYGDYLIFSKPGEDRIMLNIGGIANFTYLPGDLDAGAVFSTDTGPGNTLMDAYAQTYFSQAYDKNASIARSGSLHQGLLDALLDHDFFAAGFPKTTGPELFNLAYIEAAKQRAGAVAISHQDTMTTLNSFSAITIADALNRTTGGNRSFHVYSSGGGMHNPLLMGHLRSLLPQHQFYTTAALQVNPDAKEALLFAVLANECIAGTAQPIGGGRDIPRVSMGKISFPD
ncbi:MAG: anhydro-N-acetylmuramic acid kinase [Chitinophagaceae bacterium]|nr:anhydro-N-acetylmuramic acid kinase [Chitinophagaceae bacterium]